MLVGYHFRERSKFDPHVAEHNSSVMNDNSSGTRKRRVSWGKASVYRIDPEVSQQRNKTTVQRIQPRSALKK